MAAFNHQSPQSATGRRLLSAAEYRSQMSENYLKEQGYGLRWTNESYMSEFKRTTGSTLLARKPANLLKEAAFKVLAYALNR